MKKHLLLLIAIMSCHIVSAQTYHFIYSHDTLGNRTSRIYQGARQGSVPEIDTAKIVPGDVASVEASEDERQPSYQYTEKDTVKISPFIKTQAEKDAYQDSIMDAVMKLEPLPMGSDSGSRDLTDYSVRAIPLEYGVSGSGARTYSVPIFTAPDIKYAPSIALVYNSQGGYGYGGYGWDLAGLSAITLVGKSKYWDNEIKAASSQDTSGVFCLDGVRLVTNNDAATAALYPLVTSAGHILAAPHRNTSGYITDFTVLYPDGSVAEYGVPQTFGCTMPTYPVTRTTNIEGERIEYSYSFDAVDTLDTRPNLKEIRYGFNASGSASAKIKFSYIGTSIFSYYAGRKMTRAPRMGLIESYSGSTVLYTYSLSHQSVSDVDLLASISLTNASGEQLPPLTFTYGKDDPAYSGSHSLNAIDTLSLGAYFTSPNVIYRRGKFIRGSFDDGMISYMDEPVYSQYGSGKYKYSYPGYQPISLVPSLSEPSQYSVIWTESGFQTAETVDVDGDGIDEIVKINGLTTTSSGTTFEITVHHYNPADNPVLTTDTLLVPLSGRLYYNGSYYPHRKTYRWGDFLGNGKTQLLAVSYNNNGYGDWQTPFIALVDLETGAVLSQVYDLVSVPSEHDEQLLCTDIDGDGKTELCFSSTVGLKVYRCDTSGTFSLEKTHQNIPQSLINSEHTYYADINADGYLDIINAPSFRDTWRFFINTGVEFVERSQNLFRTSGSSFMFFDIDRDNYPDIVKLEGNTLYVYRNRRGMTIDTYYDVSRNISSGCIMLPPNIVEYTATSSLVTVDGHYIYVYGYSHFAPELRQLVQSRDSYGKIVRNTYGYLPQSSLYWTGNTSVSTEDGYQLRVLPLYVLTGAKGFMSDATNAQAFLCDTYSWYDGVVHTQGLGFCGFSKTRVLSYLDGIYQTTVNRFDPQRRGILTETVMHPYTESYPAFYDVTYTYDNHLENGKPAPRLTQSAVTKSIDGVLTTTSYIYDDFDFPVKIVTQKRTSSVTPSPTAVTTRYIHSNNPSRYVLGVVASQTSLSSKTISTTSAMGTKKVFSYDTLYRPLKCETYRATCFVPAQVADSIHCTLYHSSTDRWQYDSHGNVIREESAPSGSVVFIGKSYAYDSSGRHLLSSTDALGHTTTYSGFDQYGNPSVVTNHKGQQTSSRMDGWGRVTRTVHPDGTVDSLVRAWGGIGIYKETSLSSSSPDVIVDYDAAGREVLRSTKRFDGQWQKVQTKYDQNGNISRVSLPYRGSTPSYWNFYVYDRYNRMTNIQEASGRKTYWSYSGTKVTETKDGVKTIRQMNPDGTLQSVADSLVTITYNYRDDGQPFSVTTSTGATTFFNYDTLARKVSINDPSAGMRYTSYTTNANGSSSIIETNAIGSITTHYDSLGRVTSIVRPDFNTAFTYDTCGRLVSKVSTNGTSSRYTYDDYDRVLTVKDSVPDGKWLQKAYAYNSNGQLFTIAYTSQGGYITTETYTYNNGINTAIRLPDNTAVYQLTAENDLGQPTVASSGSVSRNYGYTAFGMPTYRKLSNGSLQNFGYSFDAKTGNLSSRSRTQGGTTTSETFYYDNLGRLTFNNGTTIVYDTNNNILYNGGNAVMTYTNASHPYEITERILSASATSGTETQTLTYKAYDRPATISQGSKTATFTYDADHDRVKMHLSGVSSDGVTRYYVGGRYEMLYDDSIAYEFLYLGGDAYTAPMVLRRVANTSWVPYVIGRDHLGSITHIATTGGTEVAHCYYDAWGNRTNTEMDDFGIARGWCGHEHLEDFGLINMNARLYDPVLGRFLSPDPYVQTPDFPGNFNRYAYCLNNPLKYTDPNGEFFFTFFLGPAGAVIDAACWGALIGGASYTASVAMSNGGFNNWDSTAFWRSVGWGAVSGAASFGIGEAFSAMGNFAGTFGTEVLRGVAHGTLNGGISALQGGNFWTGFASGTLGSWAASGYSALGLDAKLGTGGMLAFGAVSGGIGAVATGGDFWQGAAIGLMTSGLNHFQHIAEKRLFAHKLLKHYIKGSGEDYILNESDFSYIINKGAIHISPSGMIDNYFESLIDFYNSGDIDLILSFGTATIKGSFSADGTINYLGFKDVYDFNTFGATRPLYGHFLTRLGSWLSGNPFNIYFNKVIF